VAEVKRRVLLALGPIPPLEEATMDEIELTAAHEQCLRDQTITDDRPGSVLHDLDRE
jgi:hypothetical protein